MDAFSLKTRSLIAPLAVMWRGPHLLYLVLFYSFVYGSSDVTRRALIVPVAQTEIDHALSVKVCAVVSLFPATFSIIV